MKTTVITPTIGTQRLKDAIISVQEQSVRCKHLIVVDGWQYEKAVRNILIDTEYYGDIIVLPENTGGEWNGHRWNGHRIYAGIPAIVNTDYISFLDEDNWYEPGFVETMEDEMNGNDIFGATCRRNIYSQKDEFIGVDNFESIGKTEFGYYLYDMNTYFFDTMAYNSLLSEQFYRPLGADKFASEFIIKSTFKHNHIETPLVNYRAPERLTEFFKLNCTK